MKKIIDNLILVLFLITFLIVLIYNPIAIDWTSEYEYSLPSYIIKTTPQERINPISEYDFDENTKVYIYLARFNRATVPDGIENTTLLFCEDKEIVKELQKVFVFRPIQADVSKSESFIYVYQNDKLVFKSAFVFKNNLVGIQNPKNEFVEIDNQEEFVKTITKFKRSYFPVSLLRD